MEIQVSTNLETDMIFNGFTDISNSDIGTPLTPETRDYFPPINQIFPTIPEQKTLEYGQIVEYNMIKEQPKLTISKTITKITTETNDWFNNHNTRYLSRKP